MTLYSAITYGHLQTRETTFRPRNLFLSLLPILTGLPLEYTSTSLDRRESLKSEEERLLLAMVTPFGNLLLRISLNRDTGLHLATRHR